MWRGIVSLMIGSMGKLQSVVYSSLFSFVEFP
jgi:hypothetical protein